MIDYIPPDIPPAIVKYADEHYKDTEGVAKRVFKYLTIWKGNMELYSLNWYHDYPCNNGLPMILIYDCKQVRRPTLEEIRDIHYFMPKYIVSSRIKSEHLCHKDLEDFNKHNLPNPYKKKVKYYTPKYVPQPVIKYVNDKYPISWHPGTYHRYIKYLTTYEDKYEIYYVYWTDPHSDMQSEGKYIMYDCKNAREYKNNKERINLISLMSYETRMNTKSIPKLCSY